MPRSVWNSIEVVVIGVHFNSIPVFCILCDPTCIKTTSIILYIPQSKQSHLPSMLSFSSSLCCRFLQVRNTTTTTEIAMESKIMIRLKTTPITAPMVSPPLGSCDWLLSVTIGTVGGCGCGGGDREYMYRARMEGGVGR